VERGTGCRTTGERAAGYVGEGAAAGEVGVLETTSATGLTRVVKPNGGGLSSPRARRW